MPSPRPSGRRSGRAAVTRRTLAAAASVAVLAALALPAADAQTPAPTIDPLKPCYVSVNPAEREVMVIVARGFQPNAAVSITIDGQTPVTADADASGVVRAKPAAPVQSSGERAVTITLADTQAPYESVTAQTRVTALSVHVRPRTAATSHRVRFKGRGFTLARPIWGHYVFRDRVRRTVRFAVAPAGACGTFSLRARQIPIVRPRPGRWMLQIDQQKRWSARPNSVFVPIPIRVQRVIGR